MPPTPSGGFGREIDTADAPTAHTARPTRASRMSEDEGRHRESGTGQPIREPSEDDHKQPVIGEVVHQPQLRHTPICEWRPVS